jgi:hypothetical protein
MRLTFPLPALAATTLSLTLHPASAQTALNDGFARDSRQPINRAYTDPIRRQRDSHAAAAVIGSHNPQGDGRI